MPTLRVKILNLPYQACFTRWESRDTHALAAADSFADRLTESARFVNFEELERGGARGRGQKKIESNPMGTRLRVRAQSFGGEMAAWNLPAPSCKLQRVRRA